VKFTKEMIKDGFTSKLKSLYSKDFQDASDIQKYIAFSYLIKEYMSEGWFKTTKQYKNKKVKQVYYLSMEFLIGKLLEKNLINLGIDDLAKEALMELGVDLSILIDAEPDAGLGNGGLGRLAACFMDSIAALNLPGHGCGIRYKYGMFRQEIKDGYQVEMPDPWLKEPYPWEVRKENRAIKIKFGGNAYLKEFDNKLELVYENFYTVKAVPYDVQLSGYHNNTVNTLRLWSSEADTDEFDFVNFNNGNYLQSIEGKYTAELISQVLYPDDSTDIGRQLRLKQEYFFTSASIQSILNYHREIDVDFRKLNDYVALHINDTHPALAIGELMRILMDVDGLNWDEAWDITTKVCAYTNHTILSEALEKWPAHVFKKLLPRVYMIIEEINMRFCQEIIKKYGDWDRIGRMSIIENGMVKMANLAIVGSHSVNGVAKLHTEILKNKELKDFHEFYPNKFNNKTNGITHRRWLIKSNPELMKLIDESIGDNWKKNPLELEQLMSFKDDEKFLLRLEEIKHENKVKLAEYVLENEGIVIDPNSIFDIHAKRIHGYKRQLLNCLHILYLYKKLKEDKNFDIHPRTFIFSAKAAPAYVFAKKIIKLINTLGDIINNDPDINNKIKVVFIENYSVSKAEKMIPAADVSEQISTASKEASGTGNMKFMMNGAVTIATLDGANVEMKEFMGDENIVVFGLTSEEVLKLYSSHHYNSIKFLNENPEISKLVNNLVDGSLGVPTEEFHEIYRELTEKNDYYFILKDFWSYVEAQEKIETLYKDKKIWNDMCLVNIAQSGNFSSDNTIKKYADEIWGIKSEKIEG
jgi:starch phosphorylase